MKAAGGERDGLGRRVRPGARASLAGLAGLLAVACGERGEPAKAEYTRQVLDAGRVLADREREVTWVEERAAWRLLAPDVRVLVDSDGASVSARGRDGRDTRLEVRGIGRRAPRPSLVRDLRTSGSRLTVARDEGVEEWYERRADGVEHGFTLADRPAGTGPLSVWVHLDRQVALTPDTLRLLGEDGRPTGLAYAGLAAWDAAERTLSAAFALEGCDPGGCTVRIEVDDTGAAWPVTIDPLLTLEQQVLDGFQGAGHGGWDLDNDADWLIVGVPGIQEDHQGVAEIRRRNKGGRNNWGIAQTLDESTNTYGRSVAIEFPVAAVGAPAARKVFLYEFDGNQWVLLTTLTGSGQFGAALDLSPMHLAVGDPGGEQVLLYDRAEGWSQFQVVTPSAGGTDFGAALSIDGEHLVVGAPTPGGTGMVYVYRREEDGTEDYTEVDRLSPGEDVTGADFGSTVDLDGNQVVVGAPGLGRGAALTFARADLDQWPLAAKIDPPPGDDVERFGAAVALTGPFVEVLGTRADGTVERHDFEATADPRDPWVYVETLAVGTTTPGGPLSIATDAHITATGAPQTPAGGSTGQVTVFRRQHEGWEGEALDGGIGGGDTEYGAAVALSGNFAAVGAPFYDGNAGVAGAVVFFERRGGIWTVLNVLEGLTAGDKYGAHVALDGPRALICSPNLGGDGGAELIQLDGGKFVRHRVLQPGRIYESYGFTCDLSGDLAVVSTYDDAILVFARDGNNQAGSWNRVQVINGTFGERWGPQVALDDGRLAASSDDQSKVSVYQLDPSGFTFSLMAGSPLNYGEYVGGVAIQDEQVAATGYTKLSVWRREDGVWRRSDTAYPDNTQSNLAFTNDEIFVGRLIWGDVLRLLRNQGPGDGWDLTTDVFDAGDLRMYYFGSDVDASDGTLIVGASYGGAAMIFDKVANNAPHAYPDEQTTPEDTQIRFNVLANDTDPNGDLLQVSNHVAPGDVIEFTLDPDGQVTLLPAANWCSDTPDQRITFAYTASDGTKESSSTASVLVTCVNDPPRGLPLDVTTDEDTRTGGNLLVDASDPEGDPLTATLVEDAEHGVAVVEPDGDFTYLPDQDFHGSDSFSFAVSDGDLLSDPERVRVTVAPINDPPRVRDTTEPYTVAEDGQLVEPAPGLLALVTDVDSLTLTVEVVSPPTQGNLLVFANGGFVYTPRTGYVGPDAFVFVASDGLATSDPATAGLLVVDVNDLPVAVDDAWSVAEDSVLTVAEEIGLLANDYDNDDERFYLGVQLVSTPTSGTLSVGNRGGFEYRPNGNFHGEDTFTYQVTDSDNDVSNVATVTLTVRPVNDIPVAQDDLFFLDAGALLELPPAEGVLVNDADPDGDALTAVLTQVPSRGRLELGPDGELSYRPDPGFAGADRFGYLVTDGQLSSLPAEVTIRVDPGAGTTGSDTGAEDTDGDCAPVRMYVDRDGDGFGSEVEVEACAAADGLAATGGDCDDGRADIHPGAREVVGDGDDQDCNGSDGDVVPLGACRTGGPGPAWAWPLLVLALRGRRARRGTDG